MRFGRRFCSGVVPGEKAHARTRYIGVRAQSNVSGIRVPPSTMKSDHEEFGALDDQ
jgi:hypothetical protein